MRRLVREAGVKGGVTLFRGAGTAARRYLESDRSTADDYYLEAGTAIASFTVTDAHGDLVEARTLSADEYAAWVDWIDPTTGTSMGIPRLPGKDKHGSPRFAEMVVNAPKSLSIAAALHPEVSDALDAAQADAAAEIRRWLAQHSVTRVGPRGAQEVVPAEQLQTVAVVHRTSRAGDPHRHIHFQIGTRVRAAGAWRALDTAALFKQQGAIRALGTAVIAAHPQLAAALDARGLTLDPATGEVMELEQYNALMSKRGAQVERNLARIQAEWEQSHPGEEPGPVVGARMLAQAWAFQRPNKKPATLTDEEGWRAELRESGYDASTLTRATAPAVVSVDDLFIQEVAGRALDRCAAISSTWTVHTIQEQVTRMTTGYGVRATPQELCDFVRLATQLAAGDCISVLPPGAPAPEHVAHLTSLRVVAAEAQLRELLAAGVPVPAPRHLDVSELARARGLDADQEAAAAAVASTDPLVIVEGAAGSGKTAMLAVAIIASKREGRVSHVVAPTRKAADTAKQELGVPAHSVAALVYAHGWRWNEDGVWTRLAPGDIDPDTEARYDGPTEAARLRPGDRVIVDEAGMLDQDTALALLTVTAEARATVALVGDRAQLPAIGRGGVLDIAARLRGRTFNMTGLHRFTDPAYAALTLRLRDGSDPGAIFDKLQALGLIRLHADEDMVGENIAAHRAEGAAITVATNDDARSLNERIREQRVQHGEVDDARTVAGRDGLSIGAGDVIQTRRNDSRLGVANRQTFTVQHIGRDSTVFAVENTTGRKRQRTVTLPADYVAEHAHLAYASTAHGIQGTTTTEAHTVLSDALDAAGVYVGMTRGREANVLHLVAEDLTDARVQFIEAMQRDRADRGLDEATKRAREAVRGLVAQGPAKLVIEELARLELKAERAERAAAAWGRAATRLDQQTAEHTAEADESDTALQTARARADLLRAQVATSLTVAAEADGRDYLDAIDSEAQARERVARAGRLGRRRADRDHRTAQSRSAAVRGRLLEEWGSTPRRCSDNLPEWAARTAARRAESVPDVIEAAKAVAAVQADRENITERQQRERLRLLADLYGTEQVRRDPAGYQLLKPAAQAAKARTIAQQTRTEAAQLRALSPAEAARQITRQRAAVEAARRAAAEHARPFHIPANEPDYAHRPDRNGQTLGL
ncbi:MAG: TrwC relaxase [Microbacteriaceae bacterium]|nr:MAG: TrwC relaxase [Microbacteriaceae bacterium]